MVDLDRLGELSTEELETEIRAAERELNDHGPDPFGVKPCKSCGTGSPCPSYRTWARALGSLREERNARHRASSGAEA